MIEKGTILDNTYRIIDSIGAGGGGEIYLADHLRLEKRVVIKKIKDKVRGIIESRGEADILKNLNHPYLPQVYDYYINEEHVYTVMEYIEGEDFQQLLKKGAKFSSKDIIKWGTQLSEVLAYLHKQTPPIIHRDIKPSNIMLTPKGDVCLIDFNVSLEQDKTQAVTAFTDGYSPLEQYGVMKKEVPTESVKEQGYSQKDDCATEVLLDDELNRREDVTELLFEEDLQDRVSAAVQTNRENQNSRSSVAQIQGNASQVDERSDIYSLGATLYHLVAKERPAKATEQVKPLSELDVKANDGLVYIIDKSMQQMPSKRFQTAEEMHKAFVNIRKLDGEYKAYARKRDLYLGGTIILACISIVCMVLGSRKMQAENYNAYVSQIQEANNLYLRGEMEEAGEACKKAIEMRPKDLDAYIEMANIYYMWKHYEEGIAIVQGIDMSGKPSDETAANQWSILQFLAGECYMGMEEFSKAADSYKKAIEYQPEEGNYYTRCAIALARDDDKLGAEKFLEDALQKGTSEDTIYLTQAEILLSENNYKEAEDLIYKVLDITKSSDVAYHAYLTGAQIYDDGAEVIDDAFDLKRELLETAIKELDESYTLNISEQLADIYYEMANEEKDLEVAEEYYEKALVYFDDIFNSGYKNLHVLQNIASINQTLKNYEEAEKALLELVELYPEDYTGYMQLALLYSEIQDKIPAADRDYSVVLEKYDRAEILYQRHLNNGGNVDTKMQMLGNMAEDMKLLVN